MKFELNGKEWTIKEVSQDVFWEDSDEKRKFGEYFFGRTNTDSHEIWIDNSIPESEKKTTLYHELMHCYIRTFITMQTLNEENEEMICDLSANSHDIIHRIVEKYFDKKDE